jgi:ribosomal protein S18 acetylase RimI-like enzyme
MSRRWPGAAKRRPAAHRDDPFVHARYVDGITVRPLQSGDTATVSAFFARLGPDSRQKRFGGPKPRLSDAELAALARVDRDHHVLVAFVSGDPEPAGMAQLVRAGSTAELACAVADVWQGRGIGSILTRELAADARAARIAELHATIVGDNPRAVSLLVRVARALKVSWQGGERELIAALEPPQAS